MKLDLREVSGKCLVLFLLLVFSAKSPAQVYHDWTFTGITTRADPGLGPDIVVGREYSFRFTLDSARLNETQPGLFFPTVGVYFQLGNGGFGASGIGIGVLLRNDAPLDGGGSLDGIHFTALEDQDDGFPAHIRFDGTDNGITLLNPSAGATAQPFSSTAFPESLDLNAFTERSLALAYSNGELRGTVDRFYIDGVLISQVPEPRTWALLVLALSVTGFVRLSRLHRGNRGQI